MQAGVSMAEPHLGAPIDANGNLTSDGTRTFEWDARNQLVAVTVGTHRSEFVYDGLQRRVRMLEKDDGVTTADTRVLWCETAICEERAADGVTVTRRAFGLGEQVNGAALLHDRSPGLRPRGHRHHRHAARALRLRPVGAAHGHGRRRRHDRRLHGPSDAFGFGPGTDAVPGLRRGARAMGERGSDRSGRWPQPVWLCLQRTCLAF